MADNSQPHANYTPHMMLQRPCLTYPRLVVLLTRGPIKPHNYHNNLLSTKVLLKPLSKNLRNPNMTSSESFQNLTIDRHPNNTYVITLRRDPENRLNVPFCQEIIRAFHAINRELGSTSEGAVITRGSNEKFWCTGIELEDPDPWSSCDGFYPVRSLSLLHSLFLKCLGL
jgi:hypothetical protein